VVTPLRKRTLEGAVYIRSASIQALLEQLEQLSREQLIERCRIRGRSDPDYVPSECLLYLVRACRAENSSAYFEELYKILAARVLGALPKAESTGGTVVRVSLSKSRIRDKAFDRFRELLATDRQVYSEKLDYFEIRFDGAIANLRRDAEGQVWREENRAAPIELDPETIELSAEVEKAAGSYNPFENGEFGDADYQSRLDAAIESLPPEQSRIIEMLKLGTPIDSKNPEAMTIAKALKRSEKTIRTHRDLAFAALRVALSTENDDD
jgi:hypothetical protein